MKIEAKAYLDRAREDLAEAQLMHGIGLSRASARSAYFAAFHAAEALVIQQTNRVAKSHSGVRSEFARLARDLPPSDPSHTAALARLYKFKESGDYEVGAQHMISADDAADAIETARKFVAEVSTFLAI